MNKWTIMVYMAGDNNLSLDMAYALEEIKSATDANENVSLYVYYDGGSADVPTLYCEFEKGVSQNYYRSIGVKNKLINVPRVLNENSAKVDNIINFVDWCVDKHRGEIKDRHYAFIFSGHSIGFLNWGLYKDESSDYSMTHRKLKYLFERITWDKYKLGEKAKKDEGDHVGKYGSQWSDEYKLGRTKVILGKKLDLLGFDSCDMSTLEIASQFKDFSHTMVGSEGSIPNAGWNYAGLLSGRLTSEFAATPDSVAISFVENFVKQQNKFAIADISVDMTAWKLSKLPELENAFGEMAEALINCLDQDGSITYRQAKRLIVHAHSQCQRYVLEQNVDLGDFCQILIDEIDLLKDEISVDAFAPIGKLQTACQNVKKAVENCILITGFSGSDFQFSTGVSLFFPWSWSGWSSACEDYKKLSFISKSKSGQLWFRFLEKYLGEVTLRRLPQSSVVVPGKTGASTIVYDTYGISIGRCETYPNEVEAGRQPPTTGRQPPTTGRMLGSLPMFLSRFTVMRNFERDWTIAGFRSKTVEFAPETEEHNKPIHQAAAVRRIILPGSRKVFLWKELRDLIPDEESRLRFDTIAKMTGNIGLSEEDVLSYSGKLKQGADPKEVLDNLEARIKQNDS